MRLFYFISTSPKAGVVGGVRNLVAEGGLFSYYAVCVIETNEELPVIQRMYVYAGILAIESPPARASGPIPIGRYHETQASAKAEHALAQKSFNVFSKKSGHLFSISLVLHSTTVDILWHSPSSSCISASSHLA